jgi:hypothetical protein
MTKTNASAMIVANGMPPFRIPIHGWNYQGVIAWTAEQHSKRTYELIPWHRVDSVTVELGSDAALADYAGLVVLDPIMPEPNREDSCEFTWASFVGGPLTHKCMLNAGHLANNEKHRCYDRHCNAVHE